MRVEFLWFQECPNHEAARQMLREVLEEAGAPAGFEDIDVTMPEIAERVRFAGSPSIRVNGKDVEPDFQEPEDFTPRCRIYHTSAGPGGSPEKAWVKTAIETALEREGRD